MSRDSLEYIARKYELDLDVRRMPIEIPNVGRDDLAKLFAELGYTIGAEIGVSRGIYSEVLCQANPGLLLYCIDPWKAYSEYWERVSQAKFDRLYGEAVDRLTPYGCRLVRKFSMEALEDFEDRSLDFVYIDANHDFLHVTRDVDGWRRKVRKGGIVSGHDYRGQRRQVGHHVVEVVNGYTVAYRIRPWFVLGRKGRVEGEVRDRARSWMWVE